MDDDAKKERNKSNIPIPSATTIPVKFTCTCQINSVWKVQFQNKLI